MGGWGEMGGRMEGGIVGNGRMDERMKERLEVWKGGEMERQ